MSANLRSVHLILQDNALGAAKAELIHSFVYNSQVNKFVLNNHAE
jgi:hypothetical protein